MPISIFTFQFPGIKGLSFPESMQVFHNLFHTLSACKNTSINMILTKQENGKAIQLQFNGWHSWATPRYLIILFPTFFRTQIKI